MSTDTLLQDDHLDDSPQDGSPPASKQHKRTYQACEPCRNRKVRCDLGSVDAPSDPPCLRCRREKKHCYFTETRRKRKAGEVGAPELRDFGAEMRRQPSIQNGFAKRSEHIESMGVYIKNPGPLYNVRYDMAATALRPELRVKGDGDEVRNDAAAQLFKQPIHQPGDALRLLVDAASRTEIMSARPPEQQPQRPPTASTSPADEEKAADQTPHPDPGLAKMPNLEFSDPEQSQNVALQTWARLRYVRAGWFTPTEGMKYLEYFTENLSNLTPTPIPDFKNYENHVKLLTEEPMMTVTLLTIASRYKKLDGSAGASRSIYIHSMLWRECQAMVTRMFWGQEHFGGAFGLASGFRADLGEPIKRGLRALGTVEALLLLSDWHPRSMHFPPAAGNDDILAPLQTEWEEANSIMQARNPHQGWTEPVMRSDRMSWSLIGAAYNLAVELGVFDSMPEMGYFRPGYKTRAYDPARADRIGRLVHIYVSQTSGRLGYPNMLPHQGTDMDHEFFKIQLDPVENDEDPEFQAEQLQRAWCELAALMRRVNNEIFRSKQQTLELIQSKKYMEVLKSFWPALKSCLQRIESIKLPPMSRAIIMMEYEYARTYINSLALQAQIEQYAELTHQQPEGAGDPESAALFSAKMVEISKQNLPYISEVADATRGLLQHVVDDLLPSGGLKHAPVRTIFRILSGAMFLLKTFALGSKESDIQSSIGLLHRTVDALRGDVVDDCHLSLRIADLLTSLIVAIRGRFVRVPIQSKSSSSSKKHRTSLSSQKPPSNMDTRNGGYQGKRSTAELKAGIRQPMAQSSSIAVQDDLGLDQKPIAANGSDMPFKAPLVDPNDPSIMIMPPPDYMYTFSDPTGRGNYSDGQQQQPPHHGNFPSGSFGQPTNGIKGPSQPKPGNGSISSPTMDNGNGNGINGSNGANNSNGNIHPPMNFSPTPHSAQPFSPRSNSSSNGAGNSYDWYAVDMTSLVQQQQQAVGAGAGGHGVGGAGGMASANASAGVGGGQQIMSWGNMFGPEIGDSLELLNTLAADGLAFDDGLGTWNA